MTQPQPQKKKQLLYLDKSTPEEFQKAELLDWIYLVGDISTQYELDFVRQFGYALRSRPLSIHTSSTEAQEELQPSFDDVDALERKVAFYSKRMDMLQCWQSSMRDPERKIVCDILANGFTLTTKEEIDNANAAIRNATLDNILSFISAYEEYIGLDNIDGFEIYGVKSVNLKEHIESLRSTKETSP